MRTLNQVCVFVTFASLARDVGIKYTREKGKAMSYGRTNPGPYIPKETEKKEVQCGRIQKTANPEFQNYDAEGNAPKV
jgi:hypothetical protein